MAYPTVTYSLSNGETADATKLNTNWNDLIAGMSDGTKDMSINALTVAGAATLNGAVNLGNATSDDITPTGYFAGSLVPKSSSAYSLGGSSNQWANVYSDALYGDHIYEKSSGHGVDVDSVVLKDGACYLVASSIVCANSSTVYLMTSASFTAGSCIEAIAWRKDDLAAQGDGPESAYSIFFKADNGDTREILRTGQGSISISEDSGRIALNNNTATSFTFYYALCKKK